MMVIMLSPYFTIPFPLRTIFALSTLIDFLSHALGMRIFGMILPARFL